MMNPSKFFKMLSVDIPKKLLKESLEKLQQAQNIVIISHRNPDADSIGSNLALREVLEQQGKKVISACVDPLPPGTDFLKNASTYVQDFDIHWPDVIICVDAGSESQVAFASTYPDLFSGKFFLVNIDHHASNPHYGSINLVFPDAASTTIVLYYLFQQWGIFLTPYIATCLLYGLYYDTGSFMHSNTTSEVYAVASDLIQKGAKKDLIIKNLFQHYSVEQLKLWGKVFENAELTDKNIVVAGVKQKDFTDLKTTSNDLSGAINYLSMVKGNSFATLISEDNKGNIRGSLRTKHNDIDLAGIAECLGGGGHKKACGFTIPGHLEKEVKWSIKPLKKTD